MSDGRFLGAAGPFEIFGESVIVAEEVLSLVVGCAWHDVCVL